MKQIFSLLLVGVFSAVIAIIGYEAVRPPQKVVVRETPIAMHVRDLPTSANGLTAAPTDFIGAAALATPAVVNIKTISSSGYGWWNNEYSSSSGSGVIISEDGYIATNVHVVEEGSDLEVTLNDEREYKARVIGTDPTTDLALLKIEAEGLPFMQFGDSDALQVGEWVLAVGNPFNLKSTVTAGIVSAKGRSIDILDEQYRIESFIQTDAAVNPGNSGGALINTRGELVGINTAIITRSGRYEGYSFAVPANLANKVYKDLREFGGVKRGILGVTIQDVDNTIAEKLALPSVEGIYISGVTDKGGAESAGLQAGDVIVAVDGNKVKRVPELQDFIGRYRPGNQVKIEYIRSGKLYKANITLQTRSNALPVANTLETELPLLEKLGVEMRDLNEREKDRLGTNGVYVIRIEKGSVIDRTEMDPGYIITKINDIRVKNKEELIRELTVAKEKVILEGFYENYTGDYLYTFKK